MTAILPAGSALPQGNIDAGKTPAQMFSDVCANCHRRPQDLKRGASVGFLRQHYMPGSQEAAAMAAYLANLPNDPRAKDRGKEGKEKDKTAAKQPVQQQVNEKGKAPPPTKGKRPAELAKAPPEPPAETSPETAAAPAQPEPESPPIPKLEPFEE